MPVALKKVQLLWKHNGAWCFRAFGCPKERSRLLSSAGGTKGNKTAEVIRLVAIACWVRLVGSGARAENWRMAECVNVDLMTVARVIMKR